MRIIDKNLKALEDLERAKTLSPDEQVALGIKYFRNSSPYKNHKIAFEIFSLAANGNNPKAMVYLAQMYHDGLFVNNNISKCVKYLKKASSLGSVNAKCMLASIAKTGESLDVPIEDAVKYYTEAADLGSLYAKFCLADVYKSGTGIEKDINKAIEHFSECIKAEPISRNIGILAESYFGLIQCHLELQYLEEANATRDAAYYNTSKQNKETAKYYLQQATSIRDLVSSNLKEHFENTWNVYSSILNESEVNLSKMSYGEFRKRFYNKHPRIFLPTKKSEHLIYTDGIKQYFFKRDDADEELEYSLTQKQNQIEKRKVMLKLMVSNLNISKTAEQIKQIETSCLDEITEDAENFKRSYQVDYSSCVINLDKYLEEILHHIFVVQLHKRRKDILTHKIEKQKTLIQQLIDKLSLEKLQKINHFANGIDLNTKSARMNQDRHIYLLNSFITKMIDGSTPKSTAKRINNLNQYQEDTTIDQDELEIIEKINTLKSLKDRENSLKISESFQLGSLFDLTFVDRTTDEDGIKISQQNKLKDEILTFVQSINEHLTPNEIYLKLHELILKIEYFRVMVRNVASHKSILSQSLIEKGLNLCIVQESSIFNLLDELFGEFIESQIYLKDAESFVAKSTEDVPHNIVEALVYISMDDYNATNSNIQ